MSPQELNQVEHDFIAWTKKTYNRLVSVGYIDESRSGTWMEYVAVVLIPQHIRALEIAAELSGGRWTKEDYLSAARREKRGSDA